MEQHPSVNLDVVVGSMTAHQVSVTCVGVNLYRLEEEACLLLGADSDEEAESFPRYGDIMLTEPVDAQTVRYVSLHQRAPYKQFSYVLSHEAIESETTRSLLSAVVAAGGHWERQAGGVLFIAVPAGSNLDPNTVLSGHASGA